MFDFGRQSTVPFRSSEILACIRTYLTESSAIEVIFLPRTDPRKRAALIDISARVDSDLIAILSTVFGWITCKKKKVRALNLRQHLCLRTNQDIVDYAGKARQGS
jgi:hypothetical protein